jgi:hypothetical protein
MRWGLAELLAGTAAQLLPPVEVRGKRLVLAGDRA